MTNYDYTIEDTTFYLNTMVPYRIEKLMRHTPEIDRTERSYMLHTYNVADYKGFYLEYLTLM